MLQRLPSTFRRVTLAGLAGLTLLTAAPAAYAGGNVYIPNPPMIINQLNADHLAKLNRGEVVVLLKNRHPMYDLDVFGHIDGTPDQVWKTVTNYDDFDQFLPLVTESTLKSRKGNVATQLIKMNPPWPFTPKWMLNVHKEDRAKGLVTWEQADGNVKFEKGFWCVTPVAGGKTRLQYHLSVDPWMDTMPGWVVDMVLKTIMPNVVNGVRRRVKQDQQARK